MILVVQNLAVQNRVAQNLAAIKILKLVQRKTAVKKKQKHVLQTARKTVVRKNQNKENPKEDF